MLQNLRHRSLAWLSGTIALLGVAGAAQAQELKLLVVDQDMVLRESLAGQDIARQAAALRDEITGEVEAERDAIVTAERDLVDNAQMYSPAQREQKANALDDRKRKYAAFEQRQRTILQLSIAKASNDLTVAMRPVLQGIIDERDANMLLDRQAVMYADSSFDITRETITKLNETVTEVKLERVSPEDLPAEAMQHSPPLPEN